MDRCFISVVGPLLGIAARINHKHGLTPSANSLLIKLRDGLDVDPDWSTSVGPGGRERDPSVQVGSCSTAHLLQFIDAVFKPSGGIK